MEADMSDLRITFPCDYPIKVVGDARPAFQEDVFDIVVKHDPTMTVHKVSKRSSKEGNFTSISFMLVATSEQQLKDLFADLKTVEYVRLVL